MKIRHERIREAMALLVDLPVKPSNKRRGRKKVAADITDACFLLGITAPGLYDDSHPEALSRNTQKIFRWIESDSPSAIESISLLLPAIELAMPPLLLARLRSHYSETFREMLYRKERIDSDFEALFGAMIALSSRVAGGGSSGNALIH